MNADTRRQINKDRKNAMIGKELAVGSTSGGTVDVVCGIGSLISKLHMSVLQQ